MPAHLDDPKNADKRAKFLANGGTVEHINGNCGADILAGAGARRYHIPPVKAFLAQQRKRLTMTTQDMMCSIWMRYIDDNTTNGVLSTANNIDIADIQELDHCDEAGSESDDDPLVDFSGNEICRAPRVRIPDIKDNDANILAYLHQAFAQMPLLSPLSDGTVIQAATIHEYSALPITSFQARDAKGNAYRSHFRRIHWDPYATFFQKVQWTTDNDSTMTYVELAIVLSECSNGVTSEGYDLETCAKRARFTLSKYFSSGIVCEGSNSSFKAFFKPYGQISSLSAFGYPKLPGFHRKPVLHNMSDKFSNIVAAASWRACMSSSGNSFGRGVYISSTPLNIWTPCPLHETYRVIDKRKTEAARSSSSMNTISVDVHIDNSSDYECNFCAIDIIEDRCQLESTFKW